MIDRERVRALLEEIGNTECGVPPVLALSQSNRTVLQCPICEATVTVL